MQLRRRGRALEQAQIEAVTGEAEPQFSDRRFCSEPGMSGTGGLNSGSADPRWRWPGPVARLVRAAARRDLRRIRQPVRAASARGGQPGGPAIGLQPTPAQIGGRVSVPLTFPVTQRDTDARRSPRPVTANGCPGHGTLGSGCSSRKRAAASSATSELSASHSAARRRTAVDRCRSGPVRRGQRASGRRSRCRTSRKRFLRSAG